MNTAGIILAENAGAGNGPDKLWVGGTTAFVAEGTFGGGSAKLQIKLPQGTYADVTGVTLSAAGMIVADLPPGEYRAVLATGSAFYVRLSRIPS